MGLGIKAFIWKVYQKTKEKQMIPVVEKPATGHEFDGKVAWISGGSGGGGTRHFKETSQLWL